LEILGEGGMGTVYRARDRQLERDVALKLLRSAAPAPELIERLRREARILARLEHPGIVPVHDLGIDPDDCAWYAMKLVQGVTLADAFVQRPSLAARLRLLERVCDAVAFAHAQGVLHRDLKPSNVMVGGFGEVLVMDWGVAKLLDAPERTDATATTQVHSLDATRAGAVLGTPGYMAPEQAEGRSAEVDARSDVYSLGKLLADACAGAESKPPRRLRSIVAKATAPQPHDRYAGVPQLSEDLRRFLDGEAVLAHRERPWERVVRIVMRNRTLLLLFATYLVARIVVFLLSRG
jgi:serine/threonine protein kinase